MPSISWDEEVMAYVQNYIQDDAEINIYFPNLPISEGKDGAHSTENNQQFSHENVGASEARFNAEYDRGTEGQKGGDNSGDRKDGGAEVGKGDDTTERNHGEDEDAAEESQNDEDSDQDDGARDEKSGDYDSPPPPPLSCAFDQYNWAQEVNCNLPKLEPLKCQKNECDRLVHHWCQSEWEQREGCDKTVTWYCCLHHPNYIKKNQSETNDDSKGTERIDSAQEEADASLAQHGAGSNNKKVVLELIQCQVQIPKWMQWKVVL